MENLYFFDKGGLRIFYFVVTLNFLRGGDVVNY